MYLADVGLRVLDLSDPAAPRDVVTVELPPQARNGGCLLYTSDAADERSSVDLGGRRILKQKRDSHTRAYVYIHTIASTIHHTLARRHTT